MKHERYNIITMVYCKIDNCKKQKARYGIEDDKPLACGIHREKHYVNVVDRKCFCKSARPNFGYINDDRPEYCSKCRNIDMIDMKNKKCPCGTNPSFGFKDDKRPSCCSVCIKDGMMDIVHKLCACGSGKRPTLGEKNSLTPICCADCKKDGMTILHSKLCACGKGASFALEGQKAEYCLDCKSDEMVDVAHPKCKTEHCVTRNNSKYDGYCSYCYAKLFPDSPIIYNYKTKERKVVDYIKDHFTYYSWKFDKIIKDGSSQRRPDIFLDLGFQILIIEVDENQHKQYENICENRRLMELSKDVGHKSIVFIRFNPDKYKNKNNKTIESCFKFLKTGLLKINNENLWNERLQKLKDTVELWIENKSEKIVEIVQLYYDGY